MEQWCDWEGKPSDPATQYSLNVLTDVRHGRLKVSARNVIFPDPETFVAGNLTNHFATWDFITSGYKHRDEILRYISDGVSVHDFFSRFRGSFKGKYYNSKLPPKAMFSNSKSCDAFEDFISAPLLERVRNGSLSIWGKEGDCTPPHLVMPLTVEPTKPRLCHDERFLNLWMKFPKTHLDFVTDLPRYVEPIHYQTKLDDKSGYDHIRLTPDNRQFFGVYWKGYYFVYNTLPFGWSPSAYIYQSTGLAASHFIRTQGVPVTQYIDDRHVGQLRLPASAAKNWSNFELAEAAIFVTSLVLINCGYFIGIKKSVFMPTQQILFLGFISDSTSQCFSLPQDKVQKFATLRESILDSKKVSVKTLQRFAGKAISFALEVPAARLYIQEVNAAISEGIKASKPVSVAANLREELQYWRFLDTWKGSLSWRSEKHIVITLHSDASNSGWGGILHLPSGDQTTRDYWSEHDIHTPIAVREAKALYNTLSTFSSKIFNAHVDAYIDSTNLLQFWNNEGGKNFSLNMEIKNLFELTMQLNTTWELHYVPSQAQAADTPSRFRSDIDCCLSDATWRQVDSVFGPHTFDLMAIPSNVRHDRSGRALKFFSPVPCPSAEGLNIFAQALDPSETYYVFPPFVLIGALLRFLKGSGCLVTMTGAQIPRLWKPAARCDACNYTNDFDFHFCLHCGLPASSAAVSSSKISADHSAIQARFDSLTRYKQVKPYQKQKGKLQQDSESFLWSLPTKKTVATATPRNVIDFLIWKDQFGKTITHTDACKSQSDSSGCSCYRGLAAGTIDSYIGKLRTIFKNHGRGTSWNYELQLGNPASHYSVKEYHTLVLESQTVARVSPTQAKPLFLDKLVLVCDHLRQLIRPSGQNPSTLYLLCRDLAFFCVDFFSGNRASDLGRTKASDVLVAEDGKCYVFNQVFGKTLRGNHSNVFAIRRVPACSACPVSNFKLYLSLASAMSIDLRAGFLFRTTDRQGRITTDAFTGSAVANRLKKYMSELSIFEGETVHSFRSGCSVTMALLGVPLSGIARHVGWRNTDMALYYTQCDKVLSVPAPTPAEETTRSSASSTMSQLGQNFNLRNSLEGFSPIFC
eukprot:gene15556-biopygen13268